MYPINKNKTAVDHLEFMFRHSIKHIVSLAVLLFMVIMTKAQVAMPDTVCIGMSRIYRVEGSSPLSTYTWKIDGVTQASTTNQMGTTWNTAGVFQVTVVEHSPDGCDGDMRSGLVRVQPKLEADAGDDITVCFGNPAQLQGSGSGTFTWSPSTYLSDPNIANPVAGIPVSGSFTYILNITNTNICQVPGTDTVVVNILPRAQVFAGSDAIITSNQPLQLQAQDINGTGFTHYTWSPPGGLSSASVPNPVVHVDHDVTYIVTATTAQGCTATDDITIRISKVAEIYVPSAFMPAGINNVLHAIPIGIREFRYFAIYNRYGELVFKTSNPKEGWDGQYKGQPQNAGGFIWMVEGVAYDGRVITRKGNVVLIR